MYQFFACQELYVGSEYHMDTSTAHHIFKVLRLKVGREVILVSTDQRKFLAQLHPHMFLVIREMSENRELDIDITLVLAIASKEVLEFILQKGCELGVKRFLLMGTRYSPVKIKDPIKKLARWREIVKAAAMQSKRNIIPDVELITLDSLSEYVFDIMLVADELAPHEQFITKYCDRRGRSMALVIGSEGGFHRQEITELQAMGYQPVSLTPTILRAETAAMFGIISLVNYFSRR